MIGPDPGPLGSGAIARLAGRTQAMRQLFEPAAERVRRWYFTPVAVFVLGLVSIAILIGVHNVSERRTQQNVAVERALGELRITVAHWHLWLEEHLTGDEAVDLNYDVRRNQDLAIRLSWLLLWGGESENGDVIHPLREPELRREAVALEALLIEFRNLSEERLARIDEAGVGSVLDQNFDKKFRQVKDRAENLRHLYQERLAHDRADFRRDVVLVLAAWMLLIAAAVVALWRQERQRRQFEDALRTSQNWLATTLNSIGDGVVTTDLRGVVLFMNPVAETLTGWSREEAAGKPIEEAFEVLREDDDHPAQNPVARVLRYGEAVGVENHTVLISRHGERHGIDEAAAPIRDDQGQLLGTVLVFRDVTRRRRAEDDLRQRDAELRQAQKMEAVGRLAGGIAHDVNNYLGAIRGYCEIAMLKGESGEALEQRMSAAIATADKVSTLIRQLLSFSRRQEVRPQVVDLNEVVRDLELLARRLIGEEVVLVTRLDDALAAIEIDPAQLEQILVNLLVNARDALPLGGRIELATDNVLLSADFAQRHPAASPGRWVRLRVRDNGCGIPPEVRDKIFEPFFTTKAESGSSGLGLATVYGILRQSGGFVLFTSEVGRGTTFDVYLPACDRTPSQIMRARTVNAVRTRALRVLLVEDNDDMRASTCELLENLGHEVQSAASGEEALATLASDGRFELLVTDVVMPGMSGKELADRVEEQYGAIPTLFISGYTDNAILRHGIAEDQVHFLHKPFSYESLAGKISEMVGA